MNRQTINIILGAILLLAAQVLIFNRLSLNGIARPYIYPLIILILPFSTPRWMELIFAFAFGLVVDVYSSTLGMHAASLVLIAWLRPWLKSLINPSGGYEDDDQPRLRRMGYVWFITYSLILLVIHHFTYFLLEAGGFNYFGYTLAKIGTSVLCSLSIIVIIEMIFSPQKSSRRV